MTSITRSARLTLLTMLALAALAVAAPHARAVGTSYDLLVSDSSSTTVTVASTPTSLTLTSGPAGETVSSSTVITALNAGKDVFLVTGAGGTEPGRVTLEADLSATAASPGTLHVDSGSEAIVDADLALGNANIHFGIPTTLSADVDATAGTQTYAAPVTLGADSTLTSQSAVTLGGTMDGPQALMVDSPILSVLQAVGGTDPLTSLTVTGTPDLSADVTTTGAQQYDSALVLDGAVSLTSATGSVTFAGADGARALTVSAPGGTVEINGILGQSTPLTTVALHGTLIEVAAVHTTGNQTYAGPVAFALPGSGTIASDAGLVDLQGPITLDSPLIISGDAIAEGGLIEGMPTDTLTKAGQGTLTLPIGQTSTVVDTTVTHGAFEIDGTVSGATTLGGGTLTGTGTVSSVHAGVGSSIIGPGLDGFSGARVGTLSTGALTLAGTEYDVDLGTSTADVLAAHGAVNLSGASLVPTLTGSPVPGQVLTILTAPTAVTGTFTGHPEGSMFTAGGIGFTVSYHGGVTGTSVTLTRTRVASTVSVSQTSATTAAGGTVTFAANVSTPGSATPTGALTFSVDGAVVDTETLVSGQASFTTAALTAGAHAIIATYAGDSQIAGSVSAPLAHSVAAPPAVTVLPAAPVVVLNAPTLTVSGQVTTITVAKLAKTGIAATVTCSERCRAQGRVYVSAKVARAIGLIPRESKRATAVLIGYAGTSRTTAGRAVLTIRVPVGVRRALARIRTSFLIDYTTITDGAVSMTTTKQIRVRG